ncbi:HCF173 [Auxenochlorella protothecoides x Auxenochlorella symbiontica]
MSLMIPTSLSYHATHRRPAVPFNGRKNVGARKSCGIPAQHREGGPQTPREGVGDGNEGRPAESFNIDDLNPISIGRKSREVFDDVWAQLQRISSPTKRGDLPGRYLRPEFETPGAKGTKVLVTGVTGRVGRVLLRKLLLRGYTVTALVRQRGGEERQTLPPSVRLVTGDIGNYEDCREAVKDVDKVICCATARTSIVSDLERVDVEGVSNIVRAWQDSQNQRARLKHRLSRFAKLELVHFKKPYVGDDWKVQAAPERSTSAGGTGLSRVMRTAGPKDVADMEINEEGVMTFSGAVYTLYNGVRLTGRPAPSVRTGLHLTDGFIIRARGDGQIYTLTIATEAGEEYTAEWVPPPSYKSVRVALTSFKPALESLNVSDITSISIGYNASDQTERSSGRSEFSCSIDWIKCMPGGLEPDFILVSCSGATKGLDETARERVIAAKRRGERALRASGLGYTIVRPGALVEETGGYKALVFDQGTRISQGISCADVADVSLRALHCPEARNKTFAVCWEYAHDNDDGLYELVAHVPDRFNDYLSQALSTMQSNS